MKLLHDFPAENHQRQRKLIYELDNDEFVSFIIRPDGEILVTVGTELNDRCSDRICVQDGRYRQSRQGYAIYESHDQAVQAVIQYPESLILELYL